MAVKQRQVVGTILDAAGVGVSGGSLEFRLSVGVGTTDDDTTSAKYVVGGSKKVPIGDDGTVDFNLVPNDQITPSGTYWAVTYHLPGNVNHTEKWDLVDSASPIEIGDITRV